jgi:glycosyltransferase involved in cell wall biosynthesis
MRKMGARASSHAQDKSIPRVLVVSHSAMMRGGAEKSLLEILTQLHAKGSLEMTVLFPQADGPLPDAVREMGIRTEAAHYYRQCYAALSYRFTEDVKLYVKKLLDYGAAIRLARKFRGKFDLIYSNTRVVFVGVYLARLLGIPHVWHVREFSKDSGLRFASNQELLLGKMADRFIANSKAVAEDLTGSVDPRKVRVVYNGIPVAPNVEKVRHDGLNLLICGSFVPFKRQIDAVKALHLLRQAGHNHVNLHIAGSAPAGHEACLREIEAYVQEHGLQDCVVFHGYEPNMPALRARMDVELICSQCETFGRICVEGMRAGLVVIGANCGAIPELIRDNVDGLMYAPRDIEGLKDRICQTFDEGARRRLSENAVKSVSGCFLPEHTAEEVLAVMEELLIKGKKP